MRPTDLHFRSPKERTPGHLYEIYVPIFKFLNKLFSKHAKVVLYLAR